MNKAGAAIKKTVDNAEKQASQAGKSNSAKGNAAKSNAAKSNVGKGGKPDVGEQLQTDAKNALKTVEAGADKAEHAIVTTVKDIGKQGATKGSAGKAGDKNSKGPSLDQSMKEFGKNAEKAGTAMENGVKKLGSEASKQVGKADQAIKNKTEHKK